MLYKSIKEDENDNRAFRYTVGGDVMKNECDEFCPHFFTADRASVVLEGLYKNMSVFLICNGPSFAGLNHDLLRKPGIMTFGINNGARTFRPNFWTCVDDPVRFIKSIWLDPKITKFIPYNHFDKPIFDNEKWVVMDKKVKDCPNVLGYMRNEHFQPEIFLKETSLNWGNHKNFGGGRSVMLPALRILYLLGFRNVYLLGCDMKMSETYTYHFDEQRSKGAVNCNMGTYDRLKHEYLPKLQPIFDNAGFKVYNCNLDSELKCFPFISYSDAITAAIKDLGDVDNERTFGLYTDNEKREGKKEDLPVEQKEYLKVLEKVKIGEKVNIEIPDKFKKPRMPKIPVQPQSPQSPQSQVPQTQTLPPKPQNTPITSVPSVPSVPSIAPIATAGIIKHVPMPNKPKSMPVIDVSPKKIIPHPIRTEVINKPNTTQNINMDASTLKIIDKPEASIKPQNITPQLINVTPNKNINITKIDLNADKIIIS